MDEIHTFSLPSCPLLRSLNWRTCKVNTDKILDQKRKKKRHTSHEKTRWTYTIISTSQEGVVSILWVCVFLTRIGSCTSNCYGRRISHEQDARTTSTQQHEAELWSFDCKSNKGQEDSTLPREVKLFRTSAQTKRRITSKNTAPQINLKTCVDILWDVLLFAEHDKKDEWTKQRIITYSQIPSTANTTQRSLLFQGIHQTHVIRCTSTRVWRE